MEKQIKGLMFVRHVGGNKTMLVAVIDTPKELDGEVQHTFIGSVIDGKLNLQTTGHIVDIKDLARGNTPDGLLTEAIWRTA